MLTTAKITRINNVQGGCHYQVEGFPEPFPSVTTVLGVVNTPALMPWPRNVALDMVKGEVVEC